jgi:hypothetical protein
MRWSAEPQRVNDLYQPHRQLKVSEVAGEIESAKACYENA